MPQEQQRNGLNVTTARGTRSKAWNYVKKHLKFLERYRQMTLPLILVKFGLGLICVFFAVVMVYIVWIAYIMGKETWPNDEENTNQGLAIDLRTNEWTRGKLTTKDVIRRVRPGWRMRE